MGKTAYEFLYRTVEDMNEGYMDFNSYTSNAKSLELAIDDFFMQELGTISDIDNEVFHNSTYLYVEFVQDWDGSYYAQPTKL